MFVRNVENFLEKHIEGFFNKKFSSYLQDVEIFKRLEKEMYFKKKTRNKKTYVPNDYLIFLSEDDYENLYSDELCEATSGQIISCAGKNDYTIEGSLLVRFRCDKKLKKGCFCIETEFCHDEELEGADDAAEIEKEKEENTQSAPLETIVFERAKMPPKEVSTRIHFAKLSVVSGHDSGKTLDLGMARINIGRRASNEFVLSDKNTSRLHAYIVCREYKHYLIDAESLNGTYLNGKKITENILSDGDKIKVGSTILIYEVNDIA
jgi:hypothetical protein